MQFSLDFPYAYSKPLSIAKFRRFNEDFIVKETLGFELSGEGEHLCIQICKNGENTGWVAEQIAAFFGVRTMDVGYCGRKDRNAVTTQWFSVYLPKQKNIPELSFSNSKTRIDILTCDWHKQKLRLGAHKENEFEIKLRDVSELADVKNRLEYLKKTGVPNYFGEQRFGRDAGNLILAEKWFVEGEAIRKQKLRGMVMSAARSYLFNLVLARHVETASWNQPVGGESSSGLSAPLWGRGRPLSTGKLLEIEDSVLDAYPLWRNGLEHCGLEQGRRARVLIPQDLSWHIDGQDLVLKFSLLPGEFATSVLREIALLEND